MQGLKIIWITGGGSGIGRALALYWAAQGHTVVISGRRLDKLQETIVLAKGLPGPIDAMPCDVTDKTSLEECANQIHARYGRLDICVANAGYAVHKQFEAITPDEWHHQMDVNFFGAIWTMYAALPYLKKTRGSLAVVSSVSGKVASAGTAAYSASKFALVGVCNTLYQELADSGVSITAVLPGFVESDISKVDNLGVYHADRADRRPKALIYPVKKAAHKIAVAIEKRKREAVITGHGKFGVFMVNHFSGLLYRVMRRFSARSPK